MLLTHFKNLEFRIIAEIKHKYLTKMYIWCFFDNTFQKTDGRADIIDENNKEDKQQNLAFCCTIFI